MSNHPPPLPGVDPQTAPAPDEPGYRDWVEGVVFSPEGVDRALIWEHLARSPGERLATLERAVNDLLELRGGRWPEIY
jgi:hypothetical protein